MGPAEPKACRREGKQHFLGPRDEQVWLDQGVKMFK